jgi:hypothetical protein
MSDVELDVWNSLLQKTLTSASQSSTKLSTVIDAIAQAVLPVACVDRMIFLQIPLSHLLSCFILDPSLCPPDSLLSVVNSVLQGTYKTSADLMNGSLQLLHSIQTTIVVSSPSHVLHILESLRAGLQVWIEDKEEVLTENEFNLMIMPLYSDTLAVLEQHPLSLGFLKSVEFFLAAGFSRIIAPALAPLAFEKFWRATYHGQHQFSSDIPAGVISVLKRSLQCSEVIYWQESHRTHNQQQALVFPLPLSGKIIRLQNTFLLFLSMIHIAWNTPSATRLHEVYLCHLLTVHLQYSCVTLHHRLKVACLTTRRTTRATLMKFLHQISLIPVRV